MDKIVCLGKNYLEHARELRDSIPENPVIFLKPPSVLRTALQEEQIHLTIPKDQGALHYETELVLRLKSGGYRLSVEQAASCIEALTVGLDMTLRDVQDQQKKMGYPWTTSKVFPDCAVIGPWLFLKDRPDYKTTEFHFQLNGSLRQLGQAQNMRFSIEECVSYVSQFFPLNKGDLIFTGTPAGVGPVQSGDVGILGFDGIRYGVRWV